MSVWAAQRRVSSIITLFVFVVFIGIGVFLFISYEPVSCDDGVQNGAEMGVDCGGACPACPVPPKPLLDVWTRPFRVAEGVYSAVAYIENQNEDLYVPSVQFEIVLYDADRSVIGRASNFTPIMRGTVTPVFVPHIVTGKRRAESASFRFVGDPVFSPRAEPYRFIFSDVDIQIPENGSPRIGASATNAGKAVAEVDFIVIVYDEDDVAVGASRTFEKDMRSGERRDIRYTWVNPFALRRGPCPGGSCVRGVKRAEIIPVILKP